MIARVHLKKRRTPCLYRISTIIASHASARSERSKSQAHVVREWAPLKVLVKTFDANGEMTSALGRVWNVLPPGMEREDSDMKNRGEKGAAGYIAAWALGVPVSLLLIVFLLRGCT